MQPLHNRNLALDVGHLACPAVAQTARHVRGGAQPRTHTRSLQHAAIRRGRIGAALAHEWRAALGALHDLDGEGLVGACGAVDLR
eukprot:scaffold35478_cov129-Isochrysis_galbana.AAC.4